MKISFNVCDSSQAHYDHVKGYTTHINRNMLYASFLGAAFLASAALNVMTFAEYQSYSRSSSEQQRVFRDRFHRIPLREDVLLLGRFTAASFLFGIGFAGRALQFRGRRKEYEQMWAALESQQIRNGSFGERTV